MLFLASLKRNRKIDMNIITKPIFVFLASLVLLTYSSFASSFRVAQETEYSYIESTGRGPSRWGELDPAWRTCGTGTSQSPVDVTQNVQVDPTLGQLSTTYKSAPANIRSRGHDIAVFWEGDAGSINIGGTEYRLQQCHWHTTSEDAEGGRHALELHVVHAASNGATAVVAVLYDIGQPDPFLSLLLPAIRSVTKEASSVGSINPNEIGSFSGSYYRYLGSLTTPPCTEGVVWTIFQQVRTASAEQVQALKDGVVDEGFEMNARPLQALNGRVISLYQS